MSSEYRDLLAIPHARGFVITGFIGRLPMSMLGVGIILLVTGTVGSYTLAGALSGMILLAQALTSAQRGRLVDRWGQRKVLLPMVLAHTTGLTGILVTCLLHGPQLLVLAFGLAAGATFPSIGAMVRSRWTDILTGPGARKGGPKLATALSLESAVDEVVYIVGPVLATTLATAIAGPAGFVCAMLCTAVGGTLFATRPGGGLPKIPVEGPNRSVIRIPGIRVVAVVCVALGTILGAVEVSVVAYAREHHHTALAGPLVAAFSIGSLAAGLVYGSRTWARRPGFRFVAAVLAVFVGTIPIILAPNLPIIAVSVIVAGLAISPALIGAHELIQALVPANNITEGYSWIQTTVGLGLGIGVAAAGAVTDAVNAHRAFLVAGLAAVLAALLVLPFRRALNTPTVDTEGPARHGEPESLAPSAMS